MKKSYLIVTAVATSVFAVVAEDKLTVTADRVAVDNVTGVMVASGHVDAVSAPYHLKADLISCDENRKYTLADPTHVTTCTNDWEHLHWRTSGEVVYNAGHSILVKNAVVRFMDIPCLWIPFWYYPIDTDYGLRVMPGYTHRWGTYLMTKYVYRLFGSDEEGEWGLGGNTRLDIREKNGLGVGQSFRWNLADFGRGGFKAYYADDKDYDHYDRHWSSSRHYNYQNWESTVDRDRYSLELWHRVEPTERDVLRGRIQYLSDSRFTSDFSPHGLLDIKNQLAGSSGNELAWEHVESYWGGGVSVSGPVNDFRGGTARLPEAFFDIMPQPVFSTPLVYESETRVGFLNRDAKEVGNSRTSVYYRYKPGMWADYQCFRGDTYHRLTLPMRYADVLSIVPRVAFHGTHWSDSGYSNTDGMRKAGCTDQDVQRCIFEGGITFAARGYRALENGLSHVLEPYLDVLMQEAEYSGLKNGSRPYIFDSIDASRDWLDQFAGRSRNLPYSYYGITPGIRNVLRKTDEKGVERDIFDLDIYLAMQFNDTSYTENIHKYQRMPKEVEDPNWGEDLMWVPGVRMIYQPTKTVQFGLRGEWDSQEEQLAYGSILLKHELSDKFSWYADYANRNHRYYDFAPAPYQASMKDDIYNRVRNEVIEIGFEQELCDAWAWSPFIRWDLRKNEFDEVGAWIDYRLDCLGFRLVVSYENEYERVDGTEYDSDYSVGFFVYLRAFGPSLGTGYGEN